MIGIVLVRDSAPFFAYFAVKNFKTFNRKDRKGFAKVAKKNLKLDAGSRTPICVH
jgi:hypothetical protein